MPVLYCGNVQLKFAPRAIRPQTAPRLWSCRAKGLDESRRFLERDDFSAQMASVHVVGALFTSPFHGDGVVSGECPPDRYR